MSTPPTSEDPPVPSLYQQPTLALLWPADRRLTALLDFFALELSSILADSRNEFSVPPIIPLRLLRSIINNSLTDEEADECLKAFSLASVQAEDLALSLVSKSAPPKPNLDTGGNSALWDWWDDEDFIGIPNFSSPATCCNVYTIYDADNDPEISSGYSSHDDAPIPPGQSASQSLDPSLSGGWSIDEWIEVWKQNPRSRPKGLSFIGLLPRHRRQAECDRWIRQLASGSLGKTIQRGFARSLAGDLKDIVDDMLDVVKDAVSGKVTLPELPIMVSNTLPHCSWPDALRSNIADDRFYRDILIFLVAIQISRPKLVLMSAWARRYLVARRSKPYDRMRGMSLVEIRTPSPEPRKRPRSPSAGPSTKRIKILDRLE